MPNSHTSDWQPGASLAVIKARAQMLKDIRAFFAARAVLEVETPVISSTATSEVHLASWQISAPGSNHIYALHTSPELAMKRLLAAGSGDIYQVCKVFRADELGQRHNPEFTLLEWYRLGFDLPKLMQEVEQLLRQFLAAQLKAATLVTSYQQVFLDYLDCDPLTTTTAELAKIYLHHSKADVTGQLDHQDWLDLMLSQLIEPKLPQDRLVFITHYPAAQASLAQIDDKDSRVAKRFEVFFNGQELANGFEELTDYAQQHARMQNENTVRAQKGLPQVTLDERFLAALQTGLPACSGVALGLDRLLMLITGKQSIDEVLTFSFGRI